MYYAAAASMITVQAVVLWAAMALLFGAVHVAVVCNYRVNSNALIC